MTKKNSPARHPISDSSRKKFGVICVWQTNSTKRKATKLIRYEMKWNDVNQKEMCEKM